MARKALFPFLMAAALAGGYMPGYTQSTGETAGAVHPAILPEDSARAIRRQPPTVEQQAERISRQMQRRLVLDNKQYAKVYKLNLKYLKKLEDSATGWKTSPDRPDLSLSFKCNCKCINFKIMNYLKLDVWQRKLQQRKRIRWRKNLLVLPRRWKN